MEKLISCCGLDCAKCEARQATIADDDLLRAATAEKWQKMFNAPAIELKTINCTGCREEGVKFAHCYECQVRKCVNSQSFETCADCPDLETCNLVAMIHKHAPEALVNLRSLN